jgi:hypothetical protein
METTRKDEVRMMLSKFLEYRNHFENLMRYRAQKAEKLSWNKEQMVVK